MHPESPVIDVRHLEVRRRQFRLLVDDWQVAPGRVVGLVGPNGAGKTTLLRHLMGFDRPTAADVRVAGFDPWREPAEMRQRAGFAADDLPLFRMRIDRLLGQVSGYYPWWNHARVERLLDDLQLDASKRSDQLSKGEGARLRLILALAHEPRVVLLDEPAAGLDLAGRRELLRVVLEVVKDPQVCIVISSHLLTDIERIADELVVLEQGRITRAGSIDEILGDHQTLEDAMEQWGMAS